MRARGSRSCGQRHDVTKDRETGSWGRSHVALCGSSLSAFTGVGGAADREGCDTGVRAVVVQLGHVDAEWRGDAPGKPSGTRARGKM